MGNSGGIILQSVKNCVCDLILPSCFDMLRSFSRWQCYLIGWVTLLVLFLLSLDLIEKQLSVLHRRDIMIIHAMCGVIKRVQEDLTTMLHLIQINAIR